MIPSAATPARLRRLIVSVADPDRALLLYEGVLGLRLTARADPLLFLQTGDGVEVMLHVRPVERGDAAVALSFTVDDLGGVVSAWTAQGGAVIDPPRTQNWGEDQAVLRDLDGHVVCLVAAGTDRA